MTSGVPQGIAVSDFCDEFSGADTGPWRRRVGSPPTRLLWESQAAVVIPTLGPVASTHLLVLPRAHVTAVSAADLAVRRDIAQVVDRLRFVIQQRGNSAIAFEHGTWGAPDAGGCGHAHAHVHVVGSAVAFHGAPDDVPTWHQLDRVERLFESEKAESYLAFVDSDGTPWRRQAPHLPSQYLRRLVAMRTGATEWDWRSRVTDSRLAASVPVLADTVQVALAH